MTGLSFELSRYVRNAVIPLAALALLSTGCDLGGREQADMDSGVDGGDTDTDTDTDTGEDAGISDAGDAGDDWRDEDAGVTWEEGEAEIDGPCNNDCQYSYSMDPFGDWHRYGSGTFSFAAGDPGQVVARETSWVSWFLYYSWSNLQRYRHRILATYDLDETTHDLIGADVTIYRQLCGVLNTLEYSFAYDEGADELTCTVRYGDRDWTRTYSVSEAPLIMFNYNNFPVRSQGHNSSLFYYLLGERYDWTAGGIQQFTVFSPEVERLDTLTVEEGTEPGSLLVHFPPRSNIAPDGPGTWEYNSVTVTYEHDIPVSMTGRQYLEWNAVNATPTELNLTAVSGTTTAAIPAMQGGYTSTGISVTSGSDTLAGVLQDPDATGAHPAVIMLPGWGYTTRLGEVGAVNVYEQLADRLSAAGYVTVRMDNRGTGSSGGDLSSATLADLIADGVAVYAHVAGLTEVDSSKIFVLATGAGAHVAAGVAQDAGADPAGLIMLSPVGNSYGDVVSTLAQHYFESASAFENYVNEEALEAEELFEDIADGTYAGDDYQGRTNAAWQSLMASDLVGSPADLPPTLIVVPAEDHLVPASVPEALATALGTTSTDVTSGPLDGVTHALTAGTASGLWPEHSSVEEIDDTAVTLLTDWLTTQTGGK